MSDHPNQNRRIDRMEQMLTDLLQDMRDIKKAIVGDDTIGMVGLVRKQEELQRRITELEQDKQDLKDDYTKFKHKVYGIATGISVTGGVATSKLLDFFF